MHWDLVTALVYATTIGQVLGIILKIIPGFANLFIPKAVLFANFLANALLVVNKLFEAAGIPAVAESGHVVMLAGFWGSIGGALAAAGLAAAQVLWQRLIHEKVLKPVIWPDSPTLIGRGF